MRIKLKTEEQLIKEGWAWFDSNSLEFSYYKEGRKTCYLPAIMVQQLGGYVEVDSGRLNDGYYYYEEIEDTGETTITGNLSLEEKYALAEIYFKDILSSLKKEEVVQLMSFALNAFDCNNPLLFEIDGVEEPKIEKEIVRNTIVLTRGEYGLVISQMTIEKLNFVKKIKDFTGFGLKESKEAAEVGEGKVCIAGISLREALDFQELTKECRELKLRIVRIAK